MLTTEQKTTLLANINSSQDTLDAYTLGDTATLANLYNQTATPSCIVWRSSVTLDEIMQNGFDWTRVDNLGTGPARIWEWMFNNQSRSFNPAKPNVRAGIEAVWRGTAADLAVRAAVYVHCKRPALRIEKLFASGLGTDANPSVLGFEGSINPTDFIGL